MLNRIVGNVGGLRPEEFIVQMVFQRVFQTFQGQLTVPLLLTV